MKIFHIGLSAAALAFLPHSDPTLLLFLVNLIIFSLLRPFICEFIISGKAAEAISIAPMTAVLQLMTISDDNTLLVYASTTDV